jgi:Arc/MetJ family transcription regulator
MTITSIDIDQADLKQAKELAGTTSNRETVDLALRTLIAVRRQPAAVERIIGRSSTSSTTASGNGRTRVPASRSDFETSRRTI